MGTCHLYRILNLVNGKSYIGLTSDPGYRWWRHRNGYGSKLLKSAIAKYGLATFVFTVLLSGPKDYIQQCEVEAIAGFGTVSPGGYNLSSGGESGMAGCKHSLVTRRRMSVSQRARTPAPGSLRALTTARKGRAVSAETREKMAAAKRRPVIAEGVQYSSMLDAAISLGTSKRTLARKFAQWRRDGEFPSGYGYVMECVSC